MNEIPLLSDFLKGTQDERGEVSRRKETPMSQVRPKVLDPRKSRHRTGKTQKRLVGSTGKAQVQPTGNAAKFTIAEKVVIPTRASDCLPYDARYQVGDDFEGGELTKLGPGRYPEDIKAVWRARYGK